MLWIANPASPVRLRIAPPQFFYLPKVKALCPSGEIGRHNRFKICRPLGRAGSSPASGTIYIFHLVLSLQDKLSFALTCYLVPVVCGSMRSAQRTSCATKLCSRQSFSISGTINFHLFFLYKLFPSGDFWC